MANSGTFASFAVRWYVFIFFIGEVIVLLRSAAFLS